MRGARSTTTLPLNPARLLVGHGWLPYLPRAGDVHDGIAWSKIAEERTTVRLAQVRNVRRAVMRRPLAERPEIFTATVRLETARETDRDAAAAGARARGFLAG